MAWYAIDRRLITVKVFYFLTLAGFAALLPYLPIFLSQIGIKPAEIAIIYGLIFFTTFIKNATVGYLADKYQKHKLILIVSCVLTGPLYCLLVAVPSLRSQLESFPHQTVYCKLSNNALFNHSCMESSFYECDNSVCSSISIDRHTSCLTKCPQEWEVNNTIYVSESDFNSTFSTNAYLKCLLTESCERAHYTSATFWLCLVIVLTAALCGSNELMLNDAITFSILGDDRVKWGKSRLWGSTGYGLCAIFVSLLIDRLGQSTPESIDYTPAFYINLALSLTCGLVAYFHPVNEAVSTSQSTKGFKKLFLNMRVVLFMTIILVLGIYNGIFLTFGYLYIRIKFGASQLVIGGCVLVTVLVEVPTLFFGGHIVEKIGERTCLYLALAAYSIRFLAYVYIPNEWWALLVETTHLVCFALMYTAATIHASKISSKGTLATMIGVINGLKWGLGLGIGSIVGGNLAETVGFEMLFKSSGISAAVATVGLAATYELAVRYCCVKSINEGDEPNNSNSSKSDVIIEILDSPLVDDKLKAISSGDDSYYDDVISPDSAVVPLTDFHQDEAD